MVCRRMLLFWFIFLTTVAHSAFASNEPVPVEFFYSGTCPACIKIKEEMHRKLKTQYEDKIVINYHDISDDEELMLKFVLEKKFGIATDSNLQVFLPNAVFVGKEMIRKELPEAIDQMLAQGGRGPADKIISQKHPIIERFSNFSLAVITFAGLVDGINPCAFATLVFFISFLALHSYKKSQIGYIGSAFIVAVFLTYLALGLGIFHAFKKLEMFSFFSRLFYYAVALLALGLGIYSLYDYITYKRTGGTKGCSLRLHNRLRSLVDNRKGLLILIVGAFINGFIIALLESACTGQIYFPTIAFVMKVPYLRLRAFLYLVLYNLFFILPLVGVFLLAYKGITSEKVALFTNRHLGGIKLATAFLFFGLAIFLFVL